MSDKIFPLIYKLMTSSLCIAKIQQILSFLIQILIYFPVWVTIQELHRYLHITQNPHRLSLICFKKLLLPIGKSEEKYQ
jgi:hypothetical protein